MAVIPIIGAPVTGDALNGRLGRLLLDLTGSFDEAAELKEWLDQWPDADIAETLGGGLTSAKVNALKGVVNAVVALKGVFDGTATVNPARNFRNEVKVAYGIRE